MTIAELGELLRERFRRADTMAEIFTLARDTAVVESEHDFVERVQIAFGYPPGGWHMHKYTIRFGDGKESDDYLDRCLLRKIVLRRDVWDLSPHERTIAWYDGLVCHTFRELLRTGLYQELEPKENAAVLEAHALARRYRHNPPLNAAA